LDCSLNTTLLSKEWCEFARIFGLLVVWFITMIITLHSKINTDIQVVILRTDACNYTVEPWFASLQC